MNPLSPEASPQEGIPRFGADAPMAVKERERSRRRRRWRGSTGARKERWLNWAGEFDQPDASRR